MSIAVAVKPPKLTEDLERYYRNASSSWFHSIKPNRRASVSTNRTGAGHSNVVTRGPNAFIV
jgi:hypothetical protein